VSCTPAFPERLIHHICIYICVHEHTYMHTYKYVYICILTHMHLRERQCSSASRPFGICAPFLLLVLSLCLGAFRVRAARTRSTCTVFHRCATERDICAPFSASQFVGSATQPVDRIQVQMQIHVCDRRLREKRVTAHKAILRAPLEGHPAPF
jgi:hypothetical protein